MSTGSESPGGFIGSAHEYERQRGGAALLEHNAQKAFLLQLTDALRPLADAAEIQMTASRMLCEHLGAGRAMYAEIEGEPGAQVSVIRGQFVREGQPLPDRMPYFEVAGRLISEILRRGEPVVVTDVTSDPRFDEELRSAWLRAGIASLIVVSIVKQGHEDVNFGVDSMQPREWTQAEVELVQEVAERTWAVARRARAEAALRESEEKYRSLFAEMVQGYARCELIRDSQGRPVDYRFIELNPAFERLVGIPVNRAIGRTGQEIFPGSEKWWPMTFDRIIHGGHAERVEHEVAPLGRWYEMYIYPHGNDRFTVFFENITERKHAEAALRESEERQAFLLKLSDELQSLTEPGQIQAEACRLLGEHLQVDRAYYVEINEREGHARIRHDYLRGDASSVSGDFRFVDYGWVVPFLRHGDTVVVTDVENTEMVPGAERPVMSRARIRAHISMPLLKRGELVGALCVTESEPRAWSAADIELVRQTAERIWTSILRVQAEVALRERELMLQQAARTKDEFLAMLGHELRNPLSPIATTLQLMRMRTPGIMTAERDIIEKQVRYLTDMVDDLLDVSRIARGKVALKLAPVDLPEITAAAIETVQPLLEEREHPLHVDVQPGLVVQADFRRLVQVFVNLLTNAAKYSQQGRPIYLTASADGNEVVLRVRDEGVGIDPDMLPRVFDLFSQERQSLARSRGGLGLGLAIVRNLVTLHGGRVSASSEGRGSGSEFVVRLPRFKGHAAPPEAGPPSAPQTGVTEKVHSGPIRVLVVDDYALAAESLAMLLQEFGFETHIARDGAAALDAVTQFQPHIALIDIGLPVMDGYEVARAIRSMKQFESMPLIAVTGYGQESDRARVREAGFNEHLVKPINAERIGEIIETMVGPHATEADGER
jgi:signal transduction histidine kinase/ActR/RegA family two-component response regulator